MGLAAAWRWCRGNTQRSEPAITAPARETIMTRPFEGIRIIDITHVLAGPFAAYQLAVLGDHVIQATSGIMASTGTEEVNPMKIGAPAVDYATGTMGAFALASALFQRERTGKGQHIDLAMLGVAMMMQASLMTGYFRNGTEPKPHGNKQPFATNSAYDAKEGMVMIGASNLRQQARFWRAVERADMIKTDNEARIDDREREAAVIADIIKTKTADEWEVYFQARHVPAARVRRMAEAVADPHF